MPLHDELLKVVTAVSDLDFFGSSTTKYGCGKPMRTIGRPVMSGGVGVGMPAPPAYATGGATPL